MKTIIAALDFSNATPIVLEMATKLATSLGAKLHLFHAVEQAPSYSIYGYALEEFPAMHLYQEEALIRAKHQLDELLTGVKIKLPASVCQVLLGDPVHSLLDYAKQIQADLVVLGTHGHGALASLLLGSVAEGLVRKALVPILVVPARQPMDSEVKTSTPEI